MRKLGSILVLWAICVHGEVRTLTLRAAVELALKQNPDLALARLEERKAAEGVRVAKDPFVTKVFAGSGLAYSNGFPMSIEGAAPSVVQARAVQSIFNRPQTFLVAQARENARGATLDMQARRQEVGLRVALLFLDAERMGRALEAASRQAGSLERVAELVRTRVAENRELPIEGKRAALNLARARERAATLENDLLIGENSLAVVLGFSSGDQVRPAGEERTAPSLAPSEEEAVASALKDNPEIRRMESALLAKSFEVRSHQAARLPQVDLVAQYGLFAKFNHYEDYFRTFQRHNGQLGISIQIPVFTGAARDAQAEQASADMARLRLEINAARNRILLDVRRGYHQVKKAEAVREVARLDHELAREELGIVLARMEEGRAGLRQVEEARFVESEKWLSFLEAQYAVERARLSLLRQSGDLVAALR